MATDDKVVLALTHAEDDAESVLICYLLGVEALRAGKQALMWLTKDGINVGVRGFSDTVSVPGAPSIPDLHREYVDKGGQFYVCPVCVKTRQQARRRLGRQRGGEGCAVALRMDCRRRDDLQLLIVFDP